MIPINYRLSDEDAKEYCKKVDKLFQPSVPFYLRKADLLCRSLIDELNRRKYPLAGQLNCHIKRIRKLRGSAFHPSDILLTLPFELIKSICSFLNKNVIQMDLANINATITANRWRNKEVKSYCDIKMRRAILKEETTASSAGSGVKIGFSHHIRKKIQYETDFFAAEFMLFEEAYKGFSREGINSWIVEKTGVRVCPYCNLAFVYSRESYTTAQLDHFFSKAEYPMFALSFYNLVPSCPACNHIKSNAAIGASPYDAGIFSDTRITWTSPCNPCLTEGCTLPDLEKNIVIKIESKKQAVQENVAAMKLEKAYENHRDYASEVIAKMRMYLNSDAIKLLKAGCSELGLTDEDFERFYFGNYLEEAKRGSRPLAKMTGDFIDEYRRSAGK